MASNNCGTLLWCCGSLQSGATAAGVADLIAILLSVVHYVYVESIWTKPFGLGQGVFSIVMLFLFASSCLMLHGVVKKQRLLLLPWMILHQGATIAALIFVAVEFDRIQGPWALLIIGAGIKAYFFLIVLLHFIELGLLTQSPALREQPEGQDLPDLGEYRKNNCFIDLELGEKPDDSSRSSNHDHTDRSLESRVQCPKCSDELAKSALNSHMEQKHQSKKFQSYFEKKLDTRPG